VREEDYSHMVSLIRQRVDLAEVEDAQEAWEKAKRRVRCILEEFLGVPQASV
jgi:predicted metal-binding protein